MDAGTRFFFPEVRGDCPGAARLLTAGLRGEDSRFLGGAGPEASVDTCQRCACGWPGGFAGRGDAVLRAAPPFLAHAGMAGIQFGAPVFVDAAGNDVRSGQGVMVNVELTQRELDEFRGQEGAPCPTPMHAMRYAQLCMALEKRLVPADMQAYKMAVHQQKKPGASAEELGLAATVIEMVEAKVLGATSRTQRRVQKWREKKGSSVSGLRKIAQGTPVRLRAGSRRGIICEGWTLKHSADDEEEVCVQLDGDESKTNLRRDEVVTLCACGCGEDAPSLRCARCGASYYCSTACQGRHWKEHKKSCAEASPAQPSADRQTVSADSDGLGAFALGARVVVQGLRSSAQYNSRVGKVTGQAPGGRLSVELESDGKVLSLKSENLRAAAE